MNVFLKKTKMLEPCSRNKLKAEILSSCFNKVLKTSQIILFKPDLRLFPLKIIFLFQVGIKNEKLT